MLSVDAIYLQVFADRLVATNVDSGESREVRRDPLSASPRMLIAHFALSQQEFKAAVKSVRRGLRAPEVLVHPMERIEGGVTQVEFVTLLELCIGSGAARAGVHSGAGLSGAGMVGDYVRQAIRSSTHPSG